MSLYLKRPYSYASENSHLITVSLGTEKGAKQTIIITVIFIICCFAFQICYYMHYAKTTEVMDVAPLRPNISSENLPEEKVSCGQSYTCQNAKIGENWGELRYGEHCLGFHTREYSARLMDAPVLVNWKAVCESTPIEIHGHLYEKPERCERQVIVD